MEELELNVAAKQADPYKKVTTVEQAEQLHDDGVYMEFFNMLYQEWYSIKPTQAYDWTNVVKYGLRYDESQTVRIFQVVQRKDAGVTFASVIAAYTKEQLIEAKKAGGWEAVLPPSWAPFPKHTVFY